MHPCSANVVLGLRGWNVTTPSQPHPVKKETPSCQSAQTFSPVSPWMGTFILLVHQIPFKPRWSQSPSEVCKLEVWNPAWSGLLWLIYACVADFSLVPLHVKSSYAVKTRCAQRCAGVSLAQLQRHGAAGLLGNNHFISTAGQWITLKVKSRTKGRRESSISGWAATCLLALSLAANLW